MNDREKLESTLAGPRPVDAEKQYPRALGPSVPIRIRDVRPQSPAQFDELRFDEQSPAATAPPVKHALVSASAAKAESPSTFQRAVNVFRAALPYVQRVLPLLDGNVGTVVSNILAPHSQTPPPVDLAPMQNGLTKLQTQHLELRNQIQEQNAALKKVEDQLQMVREATDRNTLEQQELLGDLKKVGNKVNVFAWIALSLLLLSLGMNGYLVFHFWRVLH
jgi:hypothetical protein